MKLIQLSTDEAKKIAKDLCKEIDVARQDVSRLAERWATNESYYRSEPPKDKNLFSLHGFTPPLVYPKVQTFTGMVLNAITSNKPMVRAACPGAPESSLEYTASDLQYLMATSQVEEVLQLAAVVAAVCGKSIVWPRYELLDKGFLASDATAAQRSSLARLQCSILLDVIHPKDFFSYPSSAGNLSRSKSCGHRLTRRLKEIQALQKLGRYYGTELKPMDKSSEPDAGRNPEYDRVTPTFSGQKDDALVEIYRGITKLQRKGDSGERLYEFVLAVNEEVLLALRPHDMARPDYVDFAFHVETGKFWPSMSLAQNLQGLQLIYTQLHNLLIDGSYASAFPLVLMTRTGLGSEDTRWMPGDIRYVDGIPEVANISIQFNPSVIPMMIQQIERQAEAVAGISMNAMGQRMPTGTTATEAQHIANAQSSFTNSALAHFARGVTELWELAYAIFSQHHAAFKDHHGEAIRTSLADLHETMQFEVVGRTPSSTPAARLYGLEKLLALSQDPSLQIPKPQVVKAMIADMGLSNVVQVGSQDPTSMEAMLAEVAQEAKVAGMEGTEGGGAPGAMGEPSMAVDPRMAGELAGIGLSGDGLQLPT